MFSILLSRLFLVIMWSSRSNSGVRSHTAWGKHTFGLPHSLPVSWEAQGVRLTSCFVGAVVWSRRKSGTGRAEASVRGNLCSVFGREVGRVSQQSGETWKKGRKWMFLLEWKADVDNLVWFWWAFPSLISLPIGQIAWSWHAIQKKDSFNHFLGSQQALCELFVPLLFFLFS